MIKMPDIWRNKEVPIAVGELGLRGGIYEAFPPKYINNNLDAEGLNRMTAAVGHYEIYVENDKFEGRKIDAGYSWLPRVTLIASHAQKNPKYLQTFVFQGQAFLPRGTYINLCLPDKDWPVISKSALDHRPCNPDKIFH
jgi:hypothetical protein